VNDPRPAKKRKRLPVVGWREWISLPDLCPMPIKAKIDTGARTSSLHAFDLDLSSDTLPAIVTFEIHPVQRSSASALHVEAKVQGFKLVRSSNGDTELRPVIRTPFRVGSHQFEIDLTLTSRDEMGFRMLLGRAAIRNRFLVDSGRSYQQKGEQ
jgi:hypothetical protein